MGNICSSKKAHQIEETETNQMTIANPLTQGKGFIARKGTQLYLDGNEFRFASFNCPRLMAKGSNAFEYGDTMASLKEFAAPVTRTYTLEINSANVVPGHIVGCWNGKWQWDENRMKEVDNMIAEAGKAGVKLIIPIINQDYGNQNSNFVGNFRDLIKMKKQIKTYEEAWNVDWWTDEEMIQSFEDLITQLITRTNSITGIRYADDPTIMAWETGNEMNCNALGSVGFRPAPGSWTVRIAKHIKSLAPNTLVMDGSYARNPEPDLCWAPEVLSDDNIDILSYHYYGDGDTKRLSKDIDFVHKHEKVFIVGEYGFFAHSSVCKDLLNTVDSRKAAGSLMWSLRPHSERGGYMTHHEQDDIWSYHIPGWENRPHKEFNINDKVIVDLIYKSSYKLNNLPTPKKHPIPPPVLKVWYDQEKGGLVWTGAAWAKSYEVWLNDELLDENACCAVKDNEFVWKGPKCGASGSWTIRPKNVDGIPGQYSNQLTL